MFTDTQTSNTIHANLNQTVIHSTLRNVDLINAFMDVIKDTPEYLQISIPSYAQENEDSDFWDSEEAIYLLEGLFCVLEMYAPEGYCFGSTEGNGSDFGYWKTEE